MSNCAHIGDDGQCKEATTFGSRYCQKHTAKENKTKFFRNTKETNNAIARALKYCTTCLAGGQSVQIKLMPEGNVEVDTFVFIRQEFQTIWEDNKFRGE